MADVAPTIIPVDSIRLHRRPTQIPIEKKPDWLKVRATMGPNYLDLKALKQDLSLHTICEEAHCPNIYECWENRTATFLILGRVCTRACRFCAVTTGRPTELDREEPDRVAQAVQHLRLRHVVITSVARDDLHDGGACVFADTIRAIRRDVPGCTIEVLIPDLQGSEEGLQAIVDAGPEILNHNLETVERLQRKVRAKARYDRSLWVLRRAKELNPALRTKSGMMLGVGEAREEILQAMRDLRQIDVDILTLGQYLRPSLKHLAVERFVPPEEFAELKAIGLQLGFQHVESGPLVRSSYHAHEQAAQPVRATG
ncbi:MAG TPA: lipoyl synthase [Chloroflexota bacterium]|nr:lipoyl synthase [Chloroflexota bacterium]